MNPLIAFRERQKPPMKAAELARRLEVSRSFLARLESGERKPSPKVLKRIMDELKIPPGEMRPDLAFIEAAE